MNVILNNLIDPEGKDRHAIDPYTSSLHWFSGLVDSVTLDSQN